VTTTQTGLAASDGDAPSAPQPDLAAILNAHRGELADRMGIVVTEAGPDRLVATMPVEGNRQPYGILHGGASAVLAETVGSLSAAIVAGPDATAVGIELNATHHRSVTSGVVTAVATRVHAGRTLATFDIRIVDEARRPICTSRLTCLIRPRRPDAPGTPPPVPEPPSNPDNSTEPS
jgi:uncharacterized protein (TIGR00369 family)